MTDGDRISIIAYVRERLDKQDDSLTEIKDLLGGVNERLESLESDRDSRDGRNSFITKAAKTIAAAVITAGAAIGGYFSLKPH